MSDNTNTQTELMLKPIVLYVPNDTDVISCTLVRIRSTEDDRSYNEMSSGCFSGLVDGYDMYHKMELKLDENDEWKPFRETETETDNVNND